MSENMPLYSIWLGIDLGTTNTVAAVFRSGNPGSVEVIFVRECEFIGCGLYWSAGSFFWILDFSTASLFSRMDEID